MIKKIVVYTYGKQNKENTIRAAANFALKHDAELTGLFVKPELMQYTGIYGDYPLELAQNYYDTQSKFAAAAKESFTEVVGQVGCKAQWHVVDEHENKPNPALYADLLFVSQPSEDNNFIFNDSQFIDHLIVDTGLPLVMIPTDWASEQFGNRPILGWKESREAVHAVRHTLDIMREAETVDIVTIKKSADEDSDLINGIEISGYLTAHAINCNFLTLPIKKSEKNESEALLRYAKENACDSIIIGGYGHSRFREYILGGMTRSLINTSNLPVLLAH